MFSMSLKMEINYKTRSYFILMYYSLVVKLAILADVNHAEIKFLEPTSTIQ